MSAAGGSPGKPIRASELDCARAVIFSLPGVSISRLSAATRSLSASVKLIEPESSTIASMFETGKQLGGGERCRLGRRSGGERERGHERDDAPGAREGGDAA